MASNEYSVYAEKLKSVIRKNKNKNFEKAMAAIAAFASLSYEWNQFYIDDEIENIICDISDEMLGNLKEDETWSCDGNNIVLFYDGFGLDTRGLAAIYAKALVQLGYEVVWVTTDKARDKIPTIEEFLKKGNSKIVFLDMEKSYTRHIEELNQQFQKYKPARAFFYTTPDDVSAEITFYHYRNRVMRYMINLTDHTYWIGLHAFDYCIEFREYGAGISKVQRGVPAEKIVLLPYYPLVDKSVKFQGFPFDAEGKKVLFSGGSLYKTIGGDNKFYKIVSEVLDENKDTMFLYAGSGDDSELRRLSAQFEGRVSHIQERKDLFALMEHVDVYLNTYPVIGGLMTQYAAVAGKPPLILTDTGKQDFSGILIDQKNAGVEFDSVDAVIDEINHLLNDKAYRLRRADEIRKSVPSEKKFSESLMDIIEQRTKPCFVECPDTSAFRRDYIARFNKKTIVNAIAKRKNKKLATSFPEIFLSKVVNKCLK